MTIDFNEKFLIINDGERTAEIPWGRIESVFAYKQDLVIVDRIVTTFSVDGTEFEIDEEMEGWKALVDNMPRYLENCRDFSDWFGDVAFPAFEPKPTLIFRRLRPGEIR